MKLVPTFDMDSILQISYNLNLIYIVLFCIVWVETARILIRFDEATWERVVEPDTQGRWVFIYREKKIGRNKIEKNNNSWLQERDDMRRMENRILNITRANLFDFFI